MLIDTMKKLVLSITASFGSREKYRPERHYMRGPGPKTDLITKTDLLNKTRARAPQPVEPNKAEA